MEHTKRAELKIYEKTTTASRSKRVNTDSEQSPDSKALENRHKPGWFARPEKFMDDRPSSILSRNKKQSGNCN